MIRVMKKVLFAGVVVASSFASTSAQTSAQAVPMLKLNNGVDMPQFGLGVYMIPEGEVTKNTVMTALKAGYMPNVAIGKSV